MLGKVHTPYPNAGMLCPESILYLKLIFNFAIFEFEAASLASVILICPFDARTIREFSVGLEGTTLVRLITSLTYTDMYRYPYVCALS